MGRTIHLAFKKENDAKFSDREIETIVQVANKYNSGKLEKVWSCESFYPRPINFMTDWNGKKGYETKLILKHQLNNGNGYDWEAYIQAKIETLMQGKEITIGEKASPSIQKKYNSEKKTFTRVEAIKFLAKEGWVALCEDRKIGAEFHEFVKVQGNEFNAMLVFLACKELSILIPKMEIEMNDEGEFLLCPIRMSGGRAIPLLSRMKNQMEHLALKMLFSSGFKGNILKNLSHKKEDFTHEFQMNFQIDNGYGDMTKYINDVLRNLKEIETRLLPFVEDKKFGGRNELYTENLEGRSKEDGWFDAELFTRIKQIKVSDFVTYKMTPATLMDGFEGQYYDLSNKDGESESYKHIAQMQKMLGKLGVGNKLEILGETK